MNITINISAPELAKAIDNLAIALLNPKLTSLALPQSSINRIKKETKEIQVEKVKAQAKAEAIQKMESIVGPPATASPIRDHLIDSGLASPLADKHTPQEEAISEEAISEEAISEEAISEEAISEEALVALAKKVMLELSAPGLRKILDSVIGKKVKITDAPKERYKDLMDAMEVALKF
jgi:hypothetical protein